MQSLQHNTQFMCYFDRVEAAIAAGADLERRDSHGRTPIFYAIPDAPLPAECNVEDIEESLAALISAGARADVADDDGETPLMKAVRCNDSFSVIYCALTADVNQAGPAGDTALHQAARLGHGEAMDALLAAGADLAQENDQGYAAWEVAEQAGHQDILEIFAPAQTLAAARRVKRADMVAPSLRPPEVAPTL